MKRLLLVAGLVVFSRATPPTLVRQPPGGFFFVVGRPFLLECEATGDPTYSWTKDGEPFDMEGDRVEHLPHSGTLQVVSPLEADQGVYQCAATNAHGTASSNAVRVNISQVPLEAPKNFRLLSVKDARVAKLAWDPVSPESVRGQLRGYKIQVVSEGVSKEQVVSAGATEASVRLFNFFSRHQVKVLAFNDIGDGPPSDPLDFFPLEPGADPSCGNSVVEEGEECDAGGEDDCCDSQCKLKPGAICSDKNAPCCRGCRLEKPGTLCRESKPSACKREAFCTGISHECPASMFEADGAPCIGRGQCRHGECVPYCEIYECVVPLEAPKNVRLLYFQDGRTAKFAWDPVSPESGRGPLRGYKIQTWPVQFGEDRLKEQVVTGEDTEVLVTTLKPYSRTIVRVLAFDNKGDGLPSDLVEFITLQSTPGPVSRLEAVPFGSSALYLTWERPAEPNGVLKGNIIYHKEVTDLRETDEKRTSIDSSDTRTLLTGLKPNTTYRVGVCATTHVGEGKKSFVEVQTLDHSEMVKSYSALSKLLASMVTH